MDRPAGAVHSSPAEAGLQDAPKHHAQRCSAPLLCCPRSRAAERMLQLVQARRHRLRRGLPGTTRAPHDHDPEDVRRAGWYLQCMSAPEEEWKVQQALRSWKWCLFGAGHDTQSQLCRFAFEMQCVFCVGPLLLHPQRILSQGLHSIQLVRPSARSYVSVCMLPAHDTSCSHTAVIAAALAALRSFELASIMSPDQLERFDFVSTFKDM